MVNLLLLRARSSLTPYRPSFLHSYRSSLARTTTTAGKQASCADTGRDRDRHRHRHRIPVERMLTTSRRGDYTIIADPLVLCSGSTAYHLCLPTPRIHISPHAYTPSLHCYVFCLLGAQTPARSPCHSPTFHTTPPHTPGASTPPPPPPPPPHAASPATMTTMTTTAASISP